MSWPKIAPSGLPYWEKDPTDNLDYVINWADWLGTDVIATSAWSATGGITIGAAAFAPSKTTTATTVWLSGGSHGSRYVVTNTIVTASTPPRTRERSFEILGKNQ